MTSAHFSKAPSYMPNCYSALDKIHVVYLYEEHPEDIFTLIPQTAEEVFKCWDIERAKTVN